MKIKQIPMRFSDTNALYIIFWHQLNSVLYEDHTLLHCSFDKSYMCFTFQNREAVGRSWVSIFDKLFVFCCFIVVVFPVTFRNN